MGSSYLDPRVVASMQALTSTQSSIEVALCTTLRHPQLSFLPHLLSAMPLEATIVILDNSDYAVNSDYTPTRFDVSRSAQFGRLPRHLCAITSKSIQSAAKYRDTQIDRSCCSLPEAHTIG